MLVQQIRSAIETYNLIPPGTHLLAGVSGGADSVAMLHALSSLAAPLGFRLSVAHLNHGIRPEAHADADAVAAHCQRLGLPFHGGFANVPEMATQAGVSLEMAAREARYRFFAETATTCNADAAATAHTQDDQAETVILKLCRGSGPDGLEGIAREITLAGIRVVRPLLNSTRACVEAFLTEANIPWCEDATNADTRLKRNRVRHEVLPYIEEHFNPRIKETLARTANILSEENAFLAQLADSALKDALTKDNALRIDSLQALPPALLRRVLRNWIVQRGALAAQLRFELIERAAEMVHAKQGTGEIVLTPSHRLRREYDTLHFTSDSPEAITIPDTPLMIPGETRLDGAGLLISTELRTGYECVQPGPLGSFPARAQIRWDEEQPQQIHVQSWRPGDRIEPLGMTGSCKLQDIFVNEKLPRHLRARIPVFFCEDELVWLPGYRIARNWAVSDSKQSSLQLRVQVQ
jgi:tRNA(Ile)-lysidine synthase